MLNLVRAGSVAVLTVFAGTASHAALQFATFDCDGVIGINEAVNEGCPQTDFTNYTVDIIFNDINTIGQFSGAGIIVAAVDPVEVVPGANWNLTFGSAVVGTVPLSSPTAFFLNYTSSGLLDGDVVATLSFQTGTLGIWPHDDLADIFLGWGESDSIFDPATGTLGMASSIDLQKVPVPASMILLLGGLGGLIGLRRRATA